MHVLMVHGILDSGRIFAPMVRYLESRGIRCVAPSLKPSDGRGGLEALAGQLPATVEAVGDGPVPLVGFSMGALVARYYLQELGGYRHVRQFFAISAPFRGSLWSRFYPGKGAKQMRPGSPFLQGLERTADRLRGMSLHAYWTPFDLVIIPPTSSIWPLARNRRILAPCHPCMLHNKTLMADIHGELVRAVAQTPDSLPGREGRADELAAGEQK